MGDTSGCQINSNNLAVYLQGVSVEPSSNITSEYFVTASLPSSASTRRVLQFTTQGTITGPETATLTLDYTQAHINCPSYNITFENALNGTLTIHNQVFSANKFITYTLTSTYVLVLTVRIPKSILECFGVGKTQNYFLNININDATYTVQSFTSGSGTFTLQTTDVSGDIINFLCVGGGGGGQGSGTQGYAGGGGGGYVYEGSFTIEPNIVYTCSYSVGSGGLGSTGNCEGTSSGGSDGNSTSLVVSDALENVVINVDVSGGTGGVNGGGGNSGFITSTSSKTYKGGSGSGDNSSTACYAGGGGAGPTLDGRNALCGDGGNGGNGFQWFANNNTYSGGGGGCGTILGGLGGGNGGNGNVFTESPNPSYPTNGTLGGGGGSAILGYYVTPNGGNGGSGYVGIAYSSTSIVYN